MQQERPVQQKTVQLYEVENTRRNPPLLLADETVKMIRQGNENG